MPDITRRSFLATSAAVLAVGGRSAADPVAARRPNILFAIADDWSYPYASAYGARGINTPAFDRVAREGCLFNNCFVTAPQCSPNRAALLTSRYIWQLEEAGTHGSIFPKTYPVYPDLLALSGYHTGYTGKGWGPGEWEQTGWPHNPAGPEYNNHRFDAPPREGMSRIDYAENFQDFLKARPAEAPFCFWYGGQEPHRTYQVGSGLAAGKKLEEVKVPGFLPDAPEVRSDFLDHFLETEYFDAQLGKMLAQLEAAGELDNTMVVVTGDNGLSWPYAKANLEDYGIHVPLAVRWPGRIPAGQTQDALVSHVDLAPTFLGAAGVETPGSMEGQNFLHGLWSVSDRATATTAGLQKERAFILAGRERHTHARYDNLGYPSRAIRTKQYLYIRNFAPDRWPAGDPPGYYDIDDGPTKQFMLEHREEHPEAFQLGFGKRRGEELYDLNADPDCLHNLAGQQQLEAKQKELAALLTEQLTQQRDPRVVGPFDLFDSYPRMSEMRPELGGFAERGKYNPKYATPTLPSK